MPVVLTDKTNKVWAVEDPESSVLIAGYTGRGGASLLDLLDFITTREKQFMKFVEKRKEQEQQSGVRSGKIITKSVDV